MAESGRGRGGAESRQGGRGEGRGEAQHREQRLTSCALEEVFLLGHLDLCPHRAAPERRRGYVSAMSAQVHDGLLQHDDASKTHATYLFSDLSPSSPSMVLVCTWLCR